MVEGVKKKECEAARKAYAERRKISLLNCEIRKLIFYEKVAELVDVGMTTYLLVHFKDVLYGHVMRCVGRRQDVETKEVHGDEIKK